MKTFADRVGIATTPPAAVFFQIGAGTFTVLNNGNIGVGTTAPTSILYIEHPVNPAVDLRVNGVRCGLFDTNAGGLTRIYTQGPSSKIVLGTGVGPVDAMTIDSSQRIGIGTSPSYQLHLSQDSAAKPTSNTWMVASDRRVKKNIQPFTDGLSVVMNMEPISYKLNGKAGLPADTPGISIIANDVKDIAPYCVSTYKAKLEPDDSVETELYNFDSSSLIFVLINSIKEQQKQIGALQREVEELKSAR